MYETCGVVLQGVLACSFFERLLFRGALGRMTDRLKFHIFLRSCTDEPAPA